MLAQSYAIHISSNILNQDEINQPIRPIPSLHMSLENGLIAKALVDMQQH